MRGAGLGYEGAMIPFVTSLRPPRAAAGLRRAAFAAALAMVASACGVFGGDDEAPAQPVSNQTVIPQPSSGGGAAGSEAAPANPFMWQATLETIGFMPILELDDLAGVIETGWYIPPGAPTERFRADVAFSSRALRAESMELTMERQELDDAGNWREVPVSPAVPTNLVDSILARALVLRQESGSL
ncbi:DUF3576 domain-containing protein [Minwuia thermotolerans]|uniref:DUF3576 domain-containing protein n=1 Tax=Minwuia thermotolerans TaxID=2056226 RepID=A0A2M9G4C5_9PROT|nr:DUF3576 domain-containing protein [Minwuia thermotolerans]PJK30544.1 hypothetical protein CVT23_06265 [Minwuia thermotolerans]